MAIDKQSINEDKALSDDIKEIIKRCLIKY